MGEGNAIMFVSSGDPECWRYYCPFHWTEMLMIVCTNVLLLSAKQPNFKLLI